MFIIYTIRMVCYMQRTPYVLRTKVNLLYNNTMGLYDM